MNQMLNKPSVLLVVSDNFIAKKLTQALHIQGYKTVRAPLARDCYSAWTSPERFSMCLIDQHLEDQPGSVVAKYLAENNANNVVLFGELDDASLRLSLYHSGVALVLRKPEGANEIVAALGVIAIEKADAPRISRRVVPFPVQTSGESSWQLESLRRELVSPDGKTIALTRNEVKVCLALAAEPSEPTNREALTRSLYGRFDSSANRALDAVIKRLRQKIVATVNTVDPITTHYGEGHRFTAPIVVVSQ